MSGPATPPREPFEFPSALCFSAPEDMMAGVLAQLEQEDVDRLVRCEV